MTPRDTLSVRTFLIAHMEDCAIVQNGPTTDTWMSGGLSDWRAGAASPSVRISTLCTCGGVPIPVVWQPNHSIPEKPNDED